MTATHYLRPIALADSPQSEEGAAVRLAGGMTYASRFALIARAGGKVAAYSRFSVPELEAALPDLPPDVRAQWDALRAPRAALVCGARTIRLDQPLLMGILNVTPDSFSDGGRYLELDAACQAAERMVVDGADIIDIGGESTRPGAPAVDADTQLARVLPVVSALRQVLPQRVALSVDTRSTQVARAVLRAGAAIINDVAAGADAGMLEVVAEHGAGIVLMHMQGTPETMQQAPRYDDVVGEVREFLLSRAAAAEAAGIPKAAIALDPGIGFGKSRVHNLQLLGALDALAESAYAVLLGTSRKRFMGAICSETDPVELLGATCATTAMAVMAGVRIVRVHDVKANRQAADVAWAVGQQRPGRAG